MSPGLQHGKVTSRASAAVCAALRGYEPSDEQLEAIEFAPEPLAIIAGAGAGKTAIMAARMVSMVERGIVAPSQILGLTFTNKAAGELEERIVTAFAQIDPLPPDLPNIATYNSFADRLVREHGVRIGIDPESSLLSQGQSWQLVLKALEKIPPFDAIDSRSISTICQNALALAEECHNHFLSPEEISAEDERIVRERDGFDDEIVMASRRRLELARLVRAYEQEKLRAGCIDYGDQVSKAVEILKAFPEVAAGLAGRYPAILLDEYQDTNVAQRKMLEFLAPCGANVTAVGDARQNIFQWRGSTLFNLIDFPTKHFLREGGRPHDYLSLPANYRSGSRILAVANSLIEAVPAARRPGKPLEAVPENHEGFVGVKVLSDQRQEASFIAEEIKRLYGTPAGPGRAPMDWKDFAILVRRKKHLAPIYAALKDRDIPVEVSGLGGLVQVPEVMDLVAWLRVVADPGPPSNRWLARILLGPRFRIHFRDLAVLARWASQRTLELAKSKKHTAPQGDVVSVSDETQYEPDDVAFSLAEALEHLEQIEQLASDARARLAIFQAVVERLRAKAGGPLLELVRHAIRESGIGEALEASARRDAAASLANLGQFVGMVADFSPVDGDPSLSEFLEYLDAAEDAADPMELGVWSAEDSVKLTTVHRAKGLEFETVFVPGVAARENEKGEKVNSMFPDERTSNPMTSYNNVPHGVREDRDHLPIPWTTDDRGRQVLKRKTEFSKELKERVVEDERRLFYVALTRAKQRLYVTTAWWYERQEKCHGPSQFFDEVKGMGAAEDLGEADMPEESPLLEELAARAVWPPEPPDSLPAHPEFPEGYPVALERSITGELSPQELLQRLSDGQRQRAQDLLAGHISAIAAFSGDSGTPIEEAPVSQKPAGETIRSLSATQAVALGSQQLSLRRILRPVPQPPSPAARLGTEIHRWIEDHARGLTGLVDEEGLDHPAQHVERSRLENLRSNYLALYGKRRFARMSTGEPMAEVPFVLKLGRYGLRGRIDAVYETSDGGLEIVDFKSGARFEPPEIDQLVVYAGALAKLGVDLDRPLKLTYCYLASGETPSRFLEGPAALSALAELQRRLESLRD